MKSSINVILSFALLLFLLSNCKKKEIHKEHPEFIGNWSHIETNGERWRLEFGKRSWGTIFVTDSTGKDKELYGENGRNWRYCDENKRLYNGIFSPYLYVNQLPIAATSQIINGKDTIDPGETYCIINNDYFRKLPN